MGSFGLTKEMEEAIRLSKEKGEKKTVSKEEAEAFTKAVKEDTSFETVKDKDSEVKKAEDNGEEKELPLEELLEKEIKELSSSLGITIEEDDVWSMLFEKELVKDKIEVIPNKFEVSLRTLNSVDNKSINKKIEEFSKEGFLEDGLKNELTLNLLAHGVTKMGKPGKAKEISESLSERYDVFASLPVIVLDKIARKWNDFTRLTNAVVEKEFSQGN